DVLAVTAVGSRAVVLDRTAGVLHLPGDKRVEVPGADLVALQQPGPDSGAVVYADGARLVTQRLGGGEASSLDSQGSGTPAAPVYLAGCAYGAWTGSQRVVRDCTGDAADLVQ